MAHPVTPSSDSDDDAQHAETGALEAARRDFRRVQRILGRPLQAITGVLAVATPLSAGFLYYLLSNHIAINTPLGWLFIGGIAVVTGLHLLRQHVLGVDRSLATLETRQYVNDLKQEHGKVQELVRQEQALVTGLSDAVHKLDVAQQVIQRAMERSQGVIEGTFSAILSLTDSSELLTAEARRIASASESAHATALRAEAGVHLLQPASALDSFGDIYLGCARQADGVLNEDWRNRREEHIEALKDAIRGALIGLLRALRRWERFSIRPDADDVRYAANVMVFRSVPPERIADHPLYAHLRLDGAEPDLATARGFLELRTDLAMVLHRDRRDPDQRLADDGPLTLLAPSRAVIASWPVPGSDDPTSRFTVLPGAPIAFGIQDPDVFQGAQDIESWLRDRYTPGYGRDLDPQMGAALRDYFATHGIGSIFSQFIGHALHPLADGTESPRHAEYGQGPVYRDLDPIGVVNAHLDRPEVLPNAALTGLFATSAQPIRQLLGRLLSELLRQEDMLATTGAAPGPESDP